MGSKCATGLISCLFWSDRLLPAAARIARVFGVTVVFFPRRANKKGLRWCLLWLYRPPWHADKSNTICFSLSQIHLETANMLCKCCGVYFDVVGIKEMPHGTSEDQIFTRMAKHISDRKGPQTARCSASQTPLYLVFSGFLIKMLNELFTEMKTN